MSLSAPILEMLRCWLNLNYLFISQDAESQDGDAHAHVLTTTRTYIDEWISFLFEKGRESKASAGSTVSPNNSVFGQLFYKIPESAYPRSNMLSPTYRVVSYP